MMKKAQRKHLFKTIQGNAVSFLAVAVITAISMAVLIGMQSATDAMFERANAHYEENALETMEITCANGITQEDVEAISAWEGVAAVEGGYTSVVLWDTPQEKVLIQARSLLDEINTPLLVEGVLPAQANEAAVEEMLAAERGVGIGDELLILHDGQLTGEIFRVTAIINDPAFSCADVLDTRGMGSMGLGSAAYYVALPKAAFDEAYFGGCYTAAYIRNEELSKMYYFSDEYAAAEAALATRMEALGAERAQQRYDALLNEGRAAIADAQAQLLAFGMTEEQVQSTLADAYAQLDELEYREWMVLLRNDIGDVRGVSQIIGALRTLSYFLSLFFMAVAVVVCFTAITRMIDERRELIGAQKALGFTAGEVFRHFLMYSILCVLTAVVLSWLIAVIAEFLTVLAFRKDFLFSDVALMFRWDLAAVSALLGLIVFVGTTFVACRKRVRMPAIALLRGETPTRKKRYFFENWKGYQRLNLYTRTMIKNVLSDRGRALTTIIGVVGCIGLLFICFSLRMSILDSSKTQFDRYFLYENRLVIDSGRGDAAAFEQALAETGTDYVRVHEKLMSFRVGNRSWDSVHVLAAADFEALAPFIHLEDIHTGTTASMPENGFLISRKCAELYELSIGDSVELMGADGSRSTAAVAGVIEHYLPFHLFVSNTAYGEQVMGDGVDECVYLLRGSTDSLREQVSGMAGFLSLKDNAEFAADASVYDMVIAICICLSAVMAFLVLLNQVTMYISRKARELAVMRINGYTLKETKAFIYKDNVVLTALGLLLGCAVGMVLAYIVICIAEIGPARNVRIPSMMSVLFSCVVGSFFAWLVNVIALRRINHLSLTHINGK